MKKETKSAPLAKVSGPSRTYYEKKIDNPKTFGEYIIAMRQKLGLTQNMFARKYKVNQSYICHLENDHAKITEKKLKLACSHLKLDYKKMSVFLNSDDDKSLMKVCMRMSNKIDQIFGLLITKDSKSDKND